MTTPEEKKLASQRAQAEAAAEHSREAGVYPADEPYRVVDPNKPTTYGAHDAPYTLPKGLNVKTSFDKLRDDVAAMKAAIEIRGWPYLEPAFERLVVDLESMRQEFGVDVPTKEEAAAKAKLEAKAQDAALKSAADVKSREDAASATVAAETAAMNKAKNVPPKKSETYPNPYKKDVT